MFKKEEAENDNDKDDDDNDDDDNTTKRIEEQGMRSLIQFLSASLSALIYLKMVVLATELQVGRGGLNSKIKIKISTFMTLGYYLQ